MTALVVAVAGITPLDQAARNAPDVVRFARNADKADGVELDADRPGFLRGRHLAPRGAPIL